MLVLLSVFYLWKDTFFNDDVAALNHSLELSYVATNTLFDGPLHINQELKNVPVTPSVALWCIPPGLYTLINTTYNIFGFKITNVNIVFLILQIFAVVLAFFAFRKILNTFASFVLSLFILVFTAEIAVLADFVILPLLILVFAILFYYYHKADAKPAPLVLIFLGVLVGLVTFFKHNTGIMLFLALSSYIFFTSLQFDTQDKNKSKVSLILAPIIVVIHLIFGLVFLFQIGSIITSLYYLLPFILFFLAFIYYILFKNKNVSLKLREFFKNYAFFTASFIAIVAIWFIWFGLTVGFSRYLHSLYGMYSGFTGIWDVGIGALFTRTFDYQGISSLSAFSNTIYSLFSACLIFVPFIAALISAAVISFNLIKNNLGSIKKYLGICILGIMGIFFLYPLESVNILVSRLFLFVFILFLFGLQLKLFTKRNALILFSLLLVFMVPLLFNNISDGISAAKGDYIQISEKVNVKVRSELAREIKRAIDLIHITTEKNKYYVIDSYSVLYIYYYLTDVNQKNYFIEMRPGILDKKVTTEIVKTVADYQYLVVNKQQYDDFISGVSYNPDLDELFNYIKENYEIMNAFIKNLEHDDDQLIDFYIMGRVSTIVR